MPNGTTIVDFADDIAIVSVDKTVREIEEQTNIAIRKVGARLGLTLPAHKTEGVLINGRKLVKRMKVIVGNTKSGSKRAIKYLGVIISTTD